MALTKVSGGILDPGINVAGIVTATGFDGPFIGGGDGVNAGVGTFTGLDVNGNGDISGNLVIGGNLTANGDFTTLNTTLREVEILRVDANSSAIAGIITQRGSGNILELYDTSTNVFTVEKGGDVGIGTDNPNARLRIHDNSDNDAIVWISGADVVTEYLSLGIQTGRAILRGGGTGGTNCALSFETSTAGTESEKMRLDENGILKLGSGLTASHVANAPSNVRFFLNNNRGSYGGQDTNAVIFDNQTAALDAGGTLTFAGFSGTNPIAKASIRGGNEGTTTSLAGYFSVFTRPASGSLSEKFRITSTGSVGIGTTNPLSSMALDVVGSIRYSGQSRGANGTNAEPSYAFYGDHDTGMYRGNGVNILSFATAGTERLSIDADGAVNIGKNPAQSTGTNTQNAILTLKGYPGGNESSAAILALIRGYDTTSATTDHTIGRIVFGDKQAGEYAFIEGEVEANGGSVGDTPGRLVFSTANDGTSAPTEKLRISQNGQVCIGSGFVGGGGQLTIRGLGVNSYAVQDYQYVGTPSDNDTLAQIRFTANTSGANVIQGARIRAVADGDWGTSGDAPTRLEFHTAPDGSATMVNRMTITQDGRIGMHDSTPNDYELDIMKRSTATDAQIRLYNNATGATNDTVMRYQIGGTSANNYIYFGDGDDSNAGQIRYSHNTDSITFDAAAAEVLKLDSTGATVTGEVAASQDYPNFRPTLDLNFVAEKKLDPRITYQRTGPASFTDEFGKVILVGGNAPRFDHDPDTKESKGLLIEESRTNYVRNSLGLGSEWVAGSGSFAVDNSITNPDGSVGAYYHTGAELYHENIDLSGASANTVIVSLWVKERSGQSGNLDIQIYQQITGSVVDLGGLSFNPATEAISLTSNYSNGTVEEYPNGWYRVSAKLTTASGNFTSSTRYDMQNAEHYVWGMQLEVGEFLTSFIPTNGATGTRGVDITKIEEDEFTEFYNDDEWTMITHTNVDNSQSLVASPSEANSINFEGDNNTKKFVTRYVTSSTDNQAYVDVIGAMSGTSYYDLVGGGVGNYNMKTAHAAKVNDVAASFNGGTVQTDTSVTMLTGGSIMNIGQAPKQCHIKRIMYYPKRLPNNQLVTLTS